jgi:hypothetical protein
LLATASSSGPALGGGGGGGGDTGFLGPFTLNGANGQNGQPDPGDDGIGDEYAGKGGQEGDSGEASASGTALCIDETNENFSTALSYSWIHNQWGDLSLQAAAGGGGGGGGSGGVFGDPELPEYWPGGDGGRGGDGQNATGNVVSTQQSAVNVTAQWVVRPGFPGIVPNPPEAHPCNILLDMGWVSAPNPNWTNGGNDVWARNVNLFITVGGTLGVTAVAVTGGPNGPITAAGVDGLGNPFFKVSTNLLESDTGSFGLGPGEVGVTIVLPGDGAQILVPPATPISSQLRGNMTALAGLGADGASGGLDIGGLGGEDGIDGSPSATGSAIGGIGGDGGINDLIDLDDDTVGETPVGGGGHGGKGGAGGLIDEHKDGIYQGIVIIEVID